tara:strand:+ start:125 stop:1186 length:1062 start_codon:yes stop_codon:yes gene_type:complete
MEYPKNTTYTEETNETEETKQKWEEIEKWVEKPLTDEEKINLENESRKILGLRLLPKRYIQSEVDTLLVELLSVLHKYKKFLHELIDLEFPPGGMRPKEREQGWRYSIPLLTEIRDILQKIYDTDPVLATTTFHGPETSSWGYNMLIIDTGDDFYNIEFWKRGKGLAFTEYPSKRVLVHSLKDRFKTKILSSSIIPHLQNFTNWDGKIPQSTSNHETGWLYYDGKDFEADYVSSPTIDDQIEFVTWILGRHDRAAVKIQGLQHKRAARKTKRNLARGRNTETKLAFRDLIKQKMRGIPLNPKFGPAIDRFHKYHDTGETRGGRKTKKNRTNIITRTKRRKRRIRKKRKSRKRD